MSARTRLAHDVRAIIDAGVRAATPANCMPEAITRLFPNAPPGRTIVVGAGKAAAQMAATFEAIYPWPINGLVVTRYGFGCQCARFEVLQASHPVPDEAGLEAAKRIEALVRSAIAGDRVIFLVSGGASSLLPAPAGGVTLSEKQALTNALLRSGAPIAEINRVRSALSRLKGGGLARACSVPVTTLAISDVVGDDPAAIGSGPTWTASAPGRSVSDILDEYVPTQWPNLANAALSAEGDQFERPQDIYEIVANSKTMLDAAAEAARSMGYDATIIDGGAEGEAREVAQAHLEVIGSMPQSLRPTIFLSGGELTVQAESDLLGIGGPNQEYVLAFALAAPSAADWLVAAVDSDGIDGNGSASGAMIHSGQLAENDWRERALVALKQHNVEKFHDRESTVLRLGATGTNVNDLRLIMFKPAHVSKPIEKSPQR